MMSGKKCSEKGKRKDDKKKKGKIDRKIIRPCRLQWTRPAMDVSRSLPTRLLVYIKLYGMTRKHQFHPFLPLATNNASGIQVLLVYIKNKTLALQSVPKNSVHTKRKISALK